MIDAVEREGNVTGPVEIVVSRVDLNASLVDAVFAGSDIVVDDPTVDDVGGAVDVLGIVDIGVCISVVFVVVGDGIVSVDGVVVCLDVVVVSVI